MVAGPPLRVLQRWGPCSLCHDFPSVPANLIVPTFRKNVKVRQPDGRLPALLSGAGILG
jgi:hypothetical protein